ncbi:MAG TPA: T9SS type A sorting domain-containing protein, partial [Candidatus Kapabacteria bacterium]|nr:T9SS type A sorting domain-containing protein [Candidatus Kapabacteria bacterium]
NVSNSSNQFEFVTIAQNGRNTFLASQMGFLEIVDKDTPSSIRNLYINLNNSIDIFPLPSFKSEVFVTINNHESITGSTLSIMDMSGRTVQLIQIESSSGYIQIPISTEDLSSGTYYAVLRSGRNVVTKQLVVVH